MRVALVHDWLITHRGGEKVLEALCGLFPHADLYTLVHAPGQLPASITARRIRTSFLQKIPGIETKYRHFLPLFPKAIESFDLRGYDLILSSSHCVAKGIRKPAGTKHLSYVHAPMRYMWDRFDDYFGKDRASVSIRAAATAVRPWLQRWDRRSATSVDAFVANSHHIAAKVKRIYGRDATVVHPFVDVERFTAQAPATPAKDGYFLWLGALAPYKRVDLAVEAFRQLRLPLWIVGAGQEAAKLRKNVPPNVRVLGHVSDEELVELYRRARALVFTADEDFGITPLESMATGRPVIAYQRGGVLETVTSKTGVFFPEQTPEALCAAVQEFTHWERTFRPEDAVTRAKEFSRERFEREMSKEIDQLLSGIPAVPTDETQAPEPELSV